jgi:hypothetical protein
MSQFSRGVRVRDTKWGGQYVGTVRRVDADGELYVTWDGQFGEHQMSPHEVEPEECPR